MTTYNFAASLFCTAQSLLRTVLDHGRWWRQKVVIDAIAAFVVEIWSRLGRTILGPCQYNFNSGVHAIGKTTVAPKTNKTTIAWWLACNSKRMPLHIKCQINNQKIQVLPNATQNWLLLIKLVTTYNFAASLFCTAQSLLRTVLDHGPLVAVKKL